MMKKIIALVAAICVLFTGVVAFAADNGKKDKGVSERTERVEPVGRNERPVEHHQPSEPAPKPQAEEPVDTSVDNVADVPSDEASQEQTDAPTDEPAEEPIEDSSDAPGEGAVEENADESTEEPADEAEKPEKPEKPAKPEGDEESEDEAIEEKPEKPELDEVAGVIPEKPENPDDEKITKDDIEKKKEERKTKKIKPEKFLKEINKFFAKADEEGKQAILEEIAELKKEMEDEFIGVFVNGDDVDFDKYNGIKPKIKNNRTLIPVRAVAEALLAEVTWDEENKKITITKDGILIEITISDEIANINGEDVVLDAPPIIENDRTLVPLRFIAEALNLDVEWDENSKTVVVE